MLFLTASLVMSACSTNSSDETASASENTSNTESETFDDSVITLVNITNSIFTERSADCFNYINTYEADVMDIHNAHIQPGGLYHYHGNPNAMFDDNPGPNGSPVIGFSADGFPIFGNYFLDSNTCSVRKALSGYSLKSGTRPSSEVDPGGTYDGLYIDDYEYTNTGDLDACNGMSINGQYGYYVTETYPWVMSCFSGTPDTPFSKGSAICLLETYPLQLFKKST